MRERRRRQRRRGRPRAALGSAARRLAGPSLVTGCALAGRGLALWVMVASVLAACAPELRFSGFLDSDRSSSSDPSDPADPADPPERSAAGGLVYAVADPESPRRSDLWRARLFDRAARPLIQTPDRDESRPVWSESASALVLEARPAAARYPAPGRLVLWKAGQERELPGERAYSELWAAWAPREARLVYVVRRLRPAAGDGLIRNGVALVDLAEDEHTLLAGGTARDRYARPAFSPDGRLVVVEHRTPRPLVTRLALFNGSGDAPRVLTSERYHATQPSFTRDGRYILFSRRDGVRGPRDLMRMEPDGSGLQPFASRPESDEHAAVGSPTRDEVAFISNRDGKRDVHLVPLAGGPARNLSKDLALEVTAPCWSPDGAHIALTAFPYDAARPKESRQRNGPATAQVLVLDREGRVVLQTSGFAPDWMPPWG